MIKIFIGVVQKFSKQKTKLFWRSSDTVQMVLEAYAGFLFLFSNASVLYQEVIGHPPSPRSPPPTLLQTPPPIKATIKGCLVPPTGAWDPMRKPPPVSAKFSIRKSLCVAGSGSVCNSPDTQSVSYWRWVYYFWFTLQIYCEKKSKGLVIFS